MKLTSKILLPIGAILLIAGATIVYYSQYYLEKQILEDYFESNSDRAERVSEQIFVGEYFKNPESRVAKERMQSFFYAMDSSEVINIVLWDPEGNLIRSKNQTGDSSATAEEKEWIKSVRETSRPLFAKKTPDGNEPLGEKCSGQVAHGYEIYVPIFIAGKLNAIADIHLSDIFIRQIIGNISSMIAILFGLLALAIFSIISFLIHRFVVDPLNQVVNAATALRNGIWDREIAVRSRHDEIGGMATSFDYMRSSLKKSFDNIRLEQEEAKMAKAEIQKSNKELKEERNQLEEKNIELKRFYDITIKRELKMIELKREIKELKNKIDLRTK
jgi:HAMP domain-containing protein